MFRENLLCFSLCPLPLVLPLGTTGLLPVVLFTSSMHIFLLMVLLRGSQPKTGVFIPGDEATKAAADQQKAVCNLEVSPFLGAKLQNTPLFPTSTTLEEKNSLYSSED